MRYYNEYRETTNNYVYNRVRIPIEGACGWCGLGSPCNKRHKGQKWYYKKLRYNRTKGTYEFHGRYPNWKMVAKTRKQWMKRYFKNKNLRHCEGYEIKW